ncbi:MAG: hypothetical protein HYZ35_02355, partial [Chloroflexi bacterium]|nr:hypothetical protein [Chloroflexota bacterium]
MELTLTRQPDSTQVAVEIDGGHSHTFDLTSLIPANGVTDRPPHPLEDPVAYGDAVYAALFPEGSRAHHTLSSNPDRLLLVTTDSDAQAVPWEYA